MNRAKGFLTNVCVSGKICVFLMIVFAGNLSATPEADFQRELNSLRQRTRRLSDQAEELRSKQPEFADWVAAQKTIYDNLARAAEFDFSNCPERLPTTLAEWDNLLKKMTEAYDAFRTQPAPENTGRLNVRDFGARGDGVTDDGDAVRRAIAAAAAGPKRHLFFPAGRYLLSSIREPNNEHVVKLSGTRDLLISGEQGTILSTQSPTAYMFVVENCDNIRFRSLHITSERPPWCSGIVTAITENSLIIDMDEFRSSPLDPMFKQSDMRGLVRFFSSKALADRKTPVLYSVPGARHLRQFEVSHRGGTEFEFKLNQKPDPAYQGTRAVYFARNHRGTFRLIGSDYCRLEAITVDSSPGMFLTVHDSAAFLITDCRTRASETAKVAVATCADCILGGGGWLGGYVADNAFSNHCDDFINLHSIPRSIQRQEGNILFLNLDLTDRQLKNLTRINLIRASSGSEEITESIPVLSASRVEYRKKIALDRRASQKSKTQKTVAVDDIVTLVRIELPYAPSPLKGTELCMDKADFYLMTKVLNRKYDVVQLPDLSFPGMVFRKNSFRDGVSRILTVGNPALVEDNTFTDRLGNLYFISLATNKSIIPPMEESYYPGNVTYKNNRFDLPDTIAFFMNVERSTSRQRRAPHFFLTGNEIRFRPFQFHRNSPVFFISGGDNVEITGNRIVLSNLPRPVLFSLQDSMLTIKNNMCKGHREQEIKQENCEILP